MRNSQLINRAMDIKFRTVSFAFLFAEEVSKISLLESSISFLKKNASTILTCVGSVGVIVTSVTAVTATPKALSLLENAKKEKGEDLTKTEKIKVVGPAYIPAVLIGASTIVCIFGANALNRRQQAALISAYALLDNSYKDYKKKINELYGDDAESSVQNEITKDKYIKKPHLTESNMPLFYDEFSQRYFNASTEQVLCAESEINRMLMTNYVVCLNEFYKLLGIDRVDYGDYLGWCNDELFETYGYSWVDFHHQKVIMYDGLEVTIITMAMEPSLC